MHESVKGSINVCAASDRSTVAMNTDLSGILDALDMPIFVVDRDCKVVSFNHAAKRGAWP